MTEQKADKKAQRPYTKPQVVRVKLSLQDTVLASGCKSDTQSGPSGSGNCAPYSCLLAGS
jgi:hypothetical protein